MGLEDEFNEGVEEWLKYFRESSALCSSDPNSHIDCAGYKKLVSLGKGALPLIITWDINNWALLFTSPEYNKRQYCSIYSVFCYRTLYDRDHKDNFELEVLQSFLLYIVREIVGSEFHIPQGIRGKLKEIENYTKIWLDENIERYS